jgi:hypothetical protein
VISIQLRLVFAIGLFACALSAKVAAQNQIYANGGSPTDANSCYSDCGGPSPATGTAKCFCDNGCHSRGDCCADRDEFCAPSAAGPACSFTSNSGYSNFCGTDLGFVFQHGSDLEVLFGDSWEWSSDHSGCFSRGANLISSDDAQGFIVGTARPSTAQGVPFRADAIPAGVANCGTFLKFDRTPASGTPYTYSTVTLHAAGSNTVLELPPGSTPTAGFSDGTNAWAMFKQGDPAHTYLAFRETNLGRNFYKVRVDLGQDSKFLNPSATRITSYVGSAPKTSNFTTPTSSAGVLLIFGRPRFWSNDSQPASSNALYLMRQDTRISTSGTSTWAPQYFTTLDANGNPQWSSTASAAGPVLTDDFKVPNQIDIKWVPQLKKWLMLYGGDVSWNLGDAGNDPAPVNDQPRHGAIHMRMADYPWGPWTRATPLLWRESMKGYIKCDATATTVPRGCEPTTYLPGTWKSQTSSAIAGCISSSPEPVQPLDSCITDLPPFFALDQRGIMYAAELLPTWTNDGAWEGTTTMMKTVTIYFLVSTWMPYQVVLAAADLKLPVRQFDTLVTGQLRAYNSKMIQVNDIALSRQAGRAPGNATSWWIAMVDGSRPSHPLQIGDEVVFRSLVDGGVTYLARSGDNVIYRAVTGSPLPDARFRWKITSTDQTLYPDGTPIVYGQTPFIVSSTDSTRRLKAKVDANGLDIVRNLVGAGADSIWTMSWACINGDTCF